MRPGKLARILLRLLAAVAVAAAFVVLDWYPTVKELGQLRRERGDFQRKIKDYKVMAAKFEFPDDKELSLLAQSDAQLLQSLPQVENDGAWLALARSSLLTREKGLANMIMVFSDAETFSPGLPGLTGWLKLQAQGIKQCQQAADPWRSYPWRGFFPLRPSSSTKLACRALGIALDVPLPALLDFINRVSWGETRLEIVCLRLEPTKWSARCWLVCRGSYQVQEPSAWLVRKEKGEGDPELLIDPDSPLLWQRINPAGFFDGVKMELPLPAMQ